MIKKYWDIIVFVVLLIITVVLMVIKSGLSAGVVLFLWGISGFINGINFALRGIK